MIPRLDCVYNSRCACCEILQEDKQLSSGRSEEVMT
nr:MAG TPA: hypothetical protein [Caudoviricetes sp.]